MNLTPSQIATVCTAFGQGEDRAVEAVQSWVAAVVRGGRWGFADPDAVIQEILVKLVSLVRAGRIETPEAFLKYVRTVAKRECVDHYYGQRRRERHEQAAPDEFDAVGDGPGAEARLAARERVSALVYLAQRLSADCRTLWRLIYVEKLGAEAVAQRLGLSAVNVRVRSHRCLEKAREIVSQARLTTEAAGS